MAHLADSRVSGFSVLVSVLFLGGSIIQSDFPHFLGV